MVIDAEVCKKLKKMASGESRASKEYRNLKRELESDADAWNVLDDIYQDTAHHHSQLIKLIGKIC